MRMGTLPVLLSVATVTLLPLGARAQYCATSPIKAQVCSGFFIESCRSETVDAVKGSDGRLYTIARCYPEVSDYRASDGLCWIRTKSRGGGLFSKGLNAALQPEFYTRTENGYELLDAEYLVFNCAER